MYNKRVILPLLEKNVCYGEALMDSGNIRGISFFKNELPVLGNGESF